MLNLTRSTNKSGFKLPLAVAADKPFFSENLRGAVVVMFEVSLLIVVALTSLSGAAELNSGDKTHLQGTGFGFELLEARLDHLQNTILQLITSLETTERDRLECQQKILEQLQKGISVKSTSPRAKQVISNCQEAEMTGIYFVKLPNQKAVIPVVCEVEIFGGGWLVIQQRIYGELDFNRNWVEYKNGFGFVAPSREFWLGLESLHQLTKNGTGCELMVEVRDETGRYGYALYSNFKIAKETEHYRLADEFKFSEGTLGNRMYVSHGGNFSNKDLDFDQFPLVHCGYKHKSGWWFYKCNDANLNGPYKKDPETGRGIFWRGWSNAATYSRMMIRCV